MGKIKSENEIKHNKRYYEIIKNWQTGIIRVILYIIICTLAIEIVFMFMLDASGEISVPIPQYIPRYIVRPTLINIGFYLIGCYLFKNKKINATVKALIPLLMLTAVVSNLIVAHYVFCTLYLALIVPLFISIIYGDIRVSKIIFWLLMPIYWIDMLMIYLTPYRDDPSSMIYNMVLGFVCLPICYLIVRNIVLYEAKKEQLIHKQYEANMKLKEEMLVDGLTGVLNHTGMFKMLEEDIAKTGEDGKLYMSIIDIDYFKEVNDTYGHEAGNKVLVKLGELLNKNSSDNVTVARYGGEEFAVIFYGMEKEDAMSVMRGMHEEFGSYSFEGIKGRITFSAGVAAYEPGQTAGEFFENADKALYEAKNTGRNRIVEYSK
ncbi:MAG: GGDEF domain-containing protein [Lachnospiraceae bacterium]|nr:GGDEF domain-containing protein [Lachnospiraceae bacterium]